MDTVSAFRQGSWIERIAGLSDVIASLRLGWRLRNSTADVIFLHCPECLWGIRLLRRRRRKQATDCCGLAWGRARCDSSSCASLVTRWPGLLAWLRSIEEMQALSAEGHIAVHSAVVNDLRSMYGFTKPITIIGNAVDAKILDQLSRLGAHRNERTGLTALVARPDRIWQRS